MSEPEEPPGLALPEVDERPSLSSEPERRRGFGRGLALAAVALIAFGGIVWYVYDGGRLSGDRSQLPVIRAESTPVRVAPSDPGGIRVEHQDRMIFQDSGRDDAASGAVVERLLPRPEKPLDRVVPPPPAPSSAAPAPERNAAQPEARQSPESAPPQPAPDSDSSEAAPASTDTAAPVADAAAPASGPANASDVVKPEPARRFLIQLGAFSTEAAGRAEWRRMRDAYTQYLGALALAVRKVSVEGKGELFRVQAGPLDESEAEAVCAALKADGQACLVVRR